MSRTALIVVDMLSSYDFSDAEKLRESVADSLPAMTALLERARAEEVLVIYVNDNYGNWNSDRHELLETAMAGQAPGLIEPIAPRARICSSSRRVTRSSTARRSSTCSARRESIGSSSSAR